MLNRAFSGFLLLASHCFFGHVQTAYAHTAQLSIDREGIKEAMKSYPFSSSKLRDIRITLVIYYNYEPNNIL